MLPTALFGQITNFTVTPNQIEIFRCTAIERNFFFYISTTEFFEDIMPTTFSFCIEQTSPLKMNPNSTKNLLLNETFSATIDYVFGNGQKSSQNYQQNFEDAKMINFFINAEKGAYLFTLNCANDNDINVNYLAFTFFAAKVKLKPLEFDSGYQLVSVPGFFNGVYAVYDTFVIYATNPLLEQGKSRSEITLSECIGDVGLMHFNPDELNSFLKTKTSNETLTS
jgi:hypothetical protein